MSYGARGGCAERAGGRCRHDVDALEAERLDVVADQGRRAPVVLDQGDHPGATGPGLEPDRAAAGVQVEEPQPADRPDGGVDSREQRLADPVGGRPGAVARGRADPAAAGGSRR